MLRTSSFFGPLNSGFVPFSSAGPEALANGEIAEVESAQAEAAEVVARAAATPAREPLLHSLVEPWAPKSSAHIRVVEGAVLLAVCGYFGWGLLRTLVGV
jgi:hypothetical protein